jgi:hypothetical protein
VCSDSSGFSRTQSPTRPGGGGKEEEENWEDEADPFPVYRGMMSVHPTAMLCSDWDMSTLQNTAPFTTNTTNTATAKTNRAKKRSGGQNRGGGGNGNANPPSLLSLNIKAPPLQPSFDPASPTPPGSGKSSASPTSELSTFCRTPTEELEDITSGRSTQRRQINTGFLGQLVRNNAAANCGEIKRRGSQASSE